MHTLHSWFLYVLSEGSWMLWRGSRLNFIVPIITLDIQTQFRRQVLRTQQILSVSICLNPYKQCGFQEIIYQICHYLLNTVILLTGKNVHEANILFGAFFSEIKVVKNNFILP
jgi:hypothetical protein